MIDPIPFIGIIVLAGIMLVQDYRYYVFPFKRVMKDNEPDS